MRPATRPKPKNDADVFRVHIDQIGDEGYDLDRPLTTAWLDQALGTDSPFRASEEGHLQVHLMRVEDVVYVRGRTSVRLKANCSRCLGPVSLGLDSPIELVLFPLGKEPPAAVDGEVVLDDLGVANYENDQVELTGVVHDEVFLELPMNPVCQETCLGLCAECGTDLNKGKCDCAPKIDPRWNDLMRIKLS